MGIIEADKSMAPTAQPPDGISNIVDSDLGEFKRLGERTGGRRLTKEPC
jgi:hypothetical protein